MYGLSAFFSWMALYMQFVCIFELNLENALRSL